MQKTKIEIESQLFKKFIKKKHDFGGKRASRVWWPDSTDGRRVAAVRGSRRTTSVLHPTSVGKVNEVLLIRGMETLPCMRPFGVESEPRRNVNPCEVKTKADNILQQVLGAL